MCSFSARTDAIETTESIIPVLTNAQTPCLETFSLTSFNVANFKEDDEAVIVDNKNVESALMPDNCVFVVEKAAPEICRLSLQFHKLELDGG